MHSTRLLILLLVTVTFCFAFGPGTEPIAKLIQDRVLFEDFKTQHNKQYADEAEEASRFAKFRTNLVRIEKLNKLKSSAKFKANKFADLTVEEFRSQYLGTRVQKNPDAPVLPEFSAAELKALPKKVDWREKKAVTAVKDQGQCGSCWAFSTVGNIEGQWALAGNKLTSLSEQFLVDCDTKCYTINGEQDCNQGCNGGLMDSAFEYVIEKGGIVSESSYPYSGADGKCEKHSVAAKISNWTMVPSNEDQMAGWLARQGPLSIAVDANLWQFYWEGIFDFYWCGSTLDHGVLLVGYDTSADVFGSEMSYWIIKNSWGADWGESGYIRMQRGQELCGITQFPCTSFV